MGHLHSGIHSIAALTFLIPSFRTEHLHCNSHCPSKRHVVIVVIYMRLLIHFYDSSVYILNLYTRKWYRGWDTYKFDNSFNTKIERLGKIKTINIRMSQNTRELNKDGSYAAFECSRNDKNRESTSRDNISKV